VSKTEAASAPLQSGLWQRGCQATRRENRGFTIIGPLFHRCPKARLELTD
jgi:hypothetical protein